MAFDWATQGASFSGKLTIKTMGAAADSSIVWEDIVSNHATLKFALRSNNEGVITENVLPTETTVSLSPSGGSANAHTLPWQVGYAPMIKLGPKHAIFVTPNLNGCAIFVGGDAASPSVIHANCQPDIADQGVPTYTSGDDPIVFGARVNEFYQRWKLPIWSDVYVALASKLLAGNKIPSANFQMLLPRDYLAGGASYASVFGSRASGSWRLFVNVQGKTRQFWPA